MKVSDIMRKIEDIQACQKCLEEWSEKGISDRNRIEAISEDIDNHLEGYIELLKSKEVK